MNESKQSETQVPWWRPGLLLFFRLSGWILGPVLLGIFLGKWLDKKYNTEPWLFLLVLGLAFLISLIGMLRDTMKEIKRIEKEAENNKLKK